jgi:hypothetical protein
MPTGRCEPGKEDGLAGSISSSSFGSVLLLPWYNGQGEWLPVEISEGVLPETSTPRENMYPARLMLSSSSAFFMFVVIHVHVHGKPYAGWYRRTNL